MKISVAIPTSSLQDESLKIDKTRKISVLARACAIFKIDTIYVYNEGNNGSDGSFMTMILRYLETPQFLRRKRRQSTRRCARASTSRCAPAWTRACALTRRLPRPWLRPLARRVSLSYVICNVRGWQTAIHAWCRAKDNRDGTLFLSFMKS